MYPLSFFRASGTGFTAKKHMANIKAIDAVKVGSIIFINSRVSML